MCGTVLLCSKTMPYALGFCKGVSTTHNAKLTRGDYNYEFWFQHALLKSATSMHVLPSANGMDAVGKCHLNDTVHPFLANFLEHKNKEPFKGATFQNKLKSTRRLFVDAMRVFAEYFPNGFERVKKTKYVRDDRPHAFFPDAIDLAQEYANGSNGLDLAENFNDTLRERFKVGREEIKDKIDQNTRRDKRNEKKEKEGKKVGELKSKKSHRARKMCNPINVFFKGDVGKDLHSSFSYLRSLKPEEQEKIGITGNGQPGRNFKKFLVDTLIPGLGDGEGSEGNMRTQKKEKKNFTTDRMKKMNKLSVEHCKGIIEQRLTELGVKAPPPPPQAEEVEEEELEREEDDAKNESGDVRDEKETRQETELGTWKSRTNSKAKNTGGSEEESDLGIMTNLLDNDNAVNYALLCSNLRTKLETFWSTFPRMIDGDLPLGAAGATCNQIEQSLMNFFTQVLGPKDVELAMFNPFIFEIA